MGNFARFALTIGAAALFAGCRGPQPFINVPRLMPQSQSTLQSTTSSQSWMLPEAKSGDLLYVTDDNVVTVYSYPNGKPVGKLTGFNSAVGECVDNKGDIYIPDYSKKRVVAEYAHAGIKPIVELKVRHVGAVGCSIDPTTGNLAVSGFGEPPTVNVFKGARGEPTLYRPSGFVVIQFCAYDEEGNLFVNGLHTWKGKPRLAELSKGSTKFVTVKLDATIDGDSALQWDGRHMAIGSYIVHDKALTPVVYRFAIKSFRGTSIGKTTLGSPANMVLQFDIFKRTLLAPNWYFVNSSEKFDVLGYRYPAGGSPIITITKHLSFPRGVVVSAVR